jgi:putative FmdB family regulatory protein
MPTYEYECDACHHAWERFQSIKAEPERVCPKCGKRKARRKIGVGAGILIGGRSEEPMGEPKSKNAGDGAKDVKAASGAEGAKGAKGAGDAKGAKGDAKQAAAAAPAAGGATEPTPPSKATHPAREGRGVGNMLDALARARQQQEMRNQNRGPGSGNHGGKPGRPGQSKGGRSSAPRRSQGR